MKGYLDFEGHEKGYKPFDLTPENIKKNIGKTICYVDRVDSRGQYFVRYAIIYGKRHSQLFISEGGHDTLDIRNIKECGIEIQED